MSTIQASRSRIIIQGHVWTNEDIQMPRLASKLIGDDIAHIPGDLESDPLLRRRPCESPGGIYQHTWCFPPPYPQAPLMCERGYRVPMLPCSHIRECCSPYVCEVALEMRILPGEDGILRGLLLLPFMELS